LTDESSLDLYRHEVVSGEVSALLYFMCSENQVDDFYSETEKLLKGLPKNNTEWTLLTDRSKNTADKNLDVKSGVMEFDRNAFRAFVKQKFEENANGYTITDDPDAAQFQMIAYVLNLEKTSPTAAEAALGKGYLGGAAAGGAAAGALISGGGYNSRVGAAAGGALLAGG